MQAFWEIVASNALVVTVLAAGMVLLSRFWRNPAGLHLLWVLILLKLCTPPLVTVHFPSPMFRSSRLSYGESISARNSALPSQKEISADEFAAAVRERNPHVAEERPGSDDRAEEIQVVPPARRRDGISWIAVLTWTWGIGIAALAIGYTCRILRFRRLLAMAELPCDAILGMAADVASRLGLEEVPRIRMLPVCISPLVWSLGGRPRVLLPAALFERLDGEAQKAILTHELAHIRRKDHWIRWLELVMTTLFWWHPVVWWACRQLQALEDQCCDAMLLGIAPQSAKTYAVALLDTLDFLSQRPVRVPLGATATRPFASLSRRIAMLKNPPLIHRLTFGRAALLAAVAALPMAVAFAAETPKDQAGPDAGKANSPSNTGSLEVTAPHQAAEAKGAAKAKSTATTSATMAQPAPKGNDDIVATSIWGLRLLRQPRFVKQLALTTDQKAKLRAIGAKVDADQEAFLAEATKKQKLSGGQLRAALRQWEQEADKKALKQAETVLSPQQMRTLREATSAEEASIRSSDIITTSIRGLRLLMQPRFTKQLALTVDQKAKLRAIGTKVSTEQADFFAEATEKQKLSGDRLDAAYLRWKSEADKKALKEVETVLSPQQMLTLRDANLAEDASDRLSDPGLVASLGGITQAQKDKLRRLDGADRQQSLRRTAEESDKKLAVLTPEQRVQLRREVLEKDLPQSSGDWAIKIKGESRPLWIYRLDPYGDFSKEQVQKELSLTAEQRNQVRAILGRSSSLKEKCAEELQKLPPQERKALQRRSGSSNISTGIILGDTPETRWEGLPEVEKKLKAYRDEQRAAFEREPAARKTTITLRKGFEALLTPEQLAKYQDMAVREDAWSTLDDWLVLRGINVSDAQRDELLRIQEDSLQDYEERQRKTGEKKLEVLTPAQREELRAKIEAAEDKQRH